MINKTIIFSLILGLGWTLFSCSPSPKKEETTAEGAETSTMEKVEPEAKPYVFFVEPLEGVILSSPVHVVMGVEGMEVEPAGEAKENKGHHHILINGNFIERGVVVPADELNIHFGKGQTETDLELEPGAYTLTLQFADGLHQSYGEAMSASIKVTVE